MTSQTVSSGNIYRLTLTVDEAFLSDPETVYPVSIDPTINVKDADDDTAGSIEDVNIYEGRPNLNADWTYMHVGYYDDTYQTGRILVRLTGFINDDRYDDLSPSQITSATFHLKEATGKAAATINLYAAAGSMTWTESGATWNNVGSTFGNHIVTVSHPRSDYAEYDITELVKGWKTGESSAAAGFILCHADEENATKGFYSAEFSTTTNRPYVIVNYDSTSGMIEADQNYVPEGQQITLTASGMEVEITWTSSNPARATVSSTGVVTGILAGQVTITASCEGYTDKNCVIWVTVPDGYFYLQNAYSEYYLKSSTSTGTSASIYLSSLTPTSENHPAEVWRINYIIDGKYIVRPMNRLVSCLVASSNSYASVQDYHYADSFSAVPISASWTIEHNSFGYAFMGNGNSDATLRPAEPATSSGVYGVVGTWSADLEHHWELSPAKGLFLRQIYNYKTVTSSTNIHVKQGQSFAFSALGLKFEYIGSLIGGVTWTSSNYDIATVDTSGKITGVGEGEAWITARANLSGVVYSQTYSINVASDISNDPISSDNIQYIRYTRITGTNWWGLGSNTDHTVSIVKSTLLPNDYCVVLDNINNGYYRCISIDDELKDTLNSLENGYQDHYSLIPAFNSTTAQENAAHSAKLETDQLVNAGYFANNTSEYYGVWAFNYTSTLNLLELWQGAIDTATQAYGVYLTLTTMYYSYLASTNSVSTNVSSAQYNTSASYLDNIDDALGSSGYTNRTVISAEERNAALGLKNPPYKPGTPVVGYETTQTTQYVRVYSEGHNSPSGSWVMRYSDIQGLTPEQIKDKFALQYPPTHYCYVNIPSGIQMYTGIAAEVSGWGAGGGIQYDIVGTLGDWFSSGIPLS